MAFYDSLIFPEKISFGAQGGPTWLTQIVVTGGGEEYRNQPNRNQRCVFNVGHAARKEDTFSLVANFFWRCRGRMHGFRYKDWTDYTSIQNQGLGVFIPLTGTTFQAYKQYYGVGSPTYERKIQKLSVIPTLIGGTAVTPVWDLNTGILTVASGTPANWSGSFHIPMRFDIDEAEFNIINRNVSEGLILGWQSIPLKEIPV